MAITQTRMIALIRAAEAFLDLLNTIREELLAQGVDAGLVAGVYALNQPDFTHVKVVAEEKAHFKVMAGRNYNAARRARLRRGTSLDADFAAAVGVQRQEKELKKKERKNPAYTAEKKVARSNTTGQLLDKAFGQTLKQIAEIEGHGKTQIVGLRDDQLAPATEQDLPLPEGMSTAPQDEDLEINRDSEEYQEFLRQTGGPLDPSKLKG